MKTETQRVIRRTGKHLMCVLQALEARWPNVEFTTVEADTSIHVEADAEYTVSEATRAFAMGALCVLQQIDG